MSDNIEGFVVRILNDREVVLNRGTMDGMYEGSFIGVIDPLTEDVIDPETGDNLGSIRRYKVALKVSQVSGRLAIAATYKTKQVNVGGTGDDAVSILSRTMMPKKIITQVERLRLEGESARPVPPSESRVHEGDRFEVITSEIAESGFTLVIL